jgi:hypothetical protein
MKMKRLMRIESLVVGMMMTAFCFAPLSASAKKRTADDEDYPCALTLDCQYDNEPIEGENFRIYLVADIDEENNLTYTSDFADSGISIDADESAEELLETAVTLETYILEQEYFDNEIEPVDEDITDSNGIINFESLNEGMYLITGEELAADNVTYVPVASLVPLPYIHDDGEHYDYAPTIMPKISLYNVGTPVSTNISVEKVWNDEGNENKRPSEITVMLFQDGKEYDTVVLNEENNWKYVWRGLDDESRWQLIEEDVPDGYSMTSVLDNGKFTVTNTFDTTITTDTTEPPPETTTQVVTGTTNPPDSSQTVTTTVTTVTTITPVTSDTTGGSTLPQTGQLMWPIPVLAAGGLILLAAGCVLRRKYSDSDEK